MIGRAIKSILPVVGGVALYALWLYAYPFIAFAALQMSNIATLSIMSGGWIASPNDNFATFATYHGWALVARTLLVVMLIGALSSQLSERPALTILVTYFAIGSVSAAVQLLSGYLPTQAIVHGIAFVGATIYFARLLPQANRSA